MNHLLVMNTPPELEDEMVDYLLSLEAVSGFTSYQVRGHGEQKRWSLAEQVTGRKKRIQFELILPAANATTVLAGLQESVGGDIFYWQQEIHASGHIEP